MNWAAMPWFERWQLMGKPSIIIVSEKNSKVILSTENYDEYKKARLMLELAEADFTTFVEFD